MSNNDWSKPAAMAIPREGYFKLEQGRYGPVFPQTPACYGFSVVGKVKPGREQAIREYGKTIEEAVKGTPNVLAPLKLHYSFVRNFTFPNSSLRLQAGVTGYEARQTTAHSGHHFDIT